ncbi:muconolactone Delta-isomerase family protein [Nakamurella sp. UYEF19]|uniref:muconolactone Delta-isomerase family protein n=1 Tax=Nakamurella sp. UYEF19 TaxID=1756392 RepID=UPI0033915906
MVLSRRLAESFPPEEFDKIIPAETARVRQLYADGVVRQIWLRGDAAGACFLIEAADLEVAQQTVDELPMARSGLSEFTVIPLTPYRGFGPT